MNLQDSDLIESDNTASVSRRSFLMRGAAGAFAAAMTPGITIIPAALRAAETKAVSASDKKETADYTVRALKRKMAPDGRIRDVFCYDGEIPGPVIRAKLNDTLRVKLINELDVPTSIHWHGMHQPGTWQMDGVDGVSHAPIPPGQEFVYEFKATPAGTHWYHSHAGVQYSDGLFAPLIVDEPTPLAKYDREEIVLINDWFLKQSDEILAGLLTGSDMKMGDGKPMAKDDGMKAGEMKGMKADAKKSMQSASNTAKADEKKSVMVKPGMKGGGMKMGGAADYGDVPFESGLINGKGRFNADSLSQLETIDVKPGETVRLRLISGASTYQFRFQIDGHPLSVIASDGAPMQPVEVDNLMISPGERFDVLLKANGKSNAWIRAVTLDGKETKALLSYSGSETVPEDKPAMLSKRALQPDQMKSRTPVKLVEKPTEIKFTLGGTMKPYAWNISGQEWPKADPIKIKTNDHVRFVLENPTMMDHPFHLHGHYFYVLGEPGKLNLKDPPQKDSINIPAGKTIVLQWLANNPGNWFFHCHIEWHLATGMARVIEIA
jgi:FtsP/CotA-like multicopper oxidase with cupredoxin domain